MILVIGATGRQGGAAARQLLRRGHPVRALVRDRDSAAALALRRDGASLAPGDLDDPDSLRTAIEGADGVFVALSMMDGHRITEAGVAAERRRGQTVVRLAAEVKVGHLVYSSIHGVDANSGIPYYESKRMLEEVIHASGVPASVLRPVSFMDNFATYNRPALDHDDLVVRLPVRPDAPMQLISTDDIGTFAAMAFDRPDDYIGRTLSLAGDILTPRAIAETFAGVSGRTARFEQTPIERVRDIDPQLAQMFAFFNEHPTPLCDIAALRTANPDLTGLESWLRTHSEWNPRD
jgi:uncharacterized protein YbjT (DUF2867 family)